MDYVLIIMVACSVLFFFFKGRRESGTDSVSDSHEMSNDLEGAEANSRIPRDFLGVEYDCLRTPKPLREMLKEDRAVVMEELVDFLNNGGTMERKHAAFALGQIGDTSALHDLETALARESVSGVRDALSASVAALRMASSDKGNTELERRRVIQDVYAGRPPRLS